MGFTVLSPYLKWAAYCLFAAIFIQNVNGKFYSFAFLVVCTIYYKLLLILSSVFVILGTIEEHPTSVTAAVDVYANFSCSVNCSQSVSLRWRLAIPRLDEVNDCYLKGRALQRMWRRKGVTIQYESATSGSSRCKVQTIKVLITSEMDGAVVQCAAIGIRNNVSSSYSKFAVLQVHSPPETAESSASDETTAAPDTSPPQ